MTRYIFVDPFTRERREVTVSSRKGGTMKVRLPTGEEIAQIKADGNFREGMDFVICESNENTMRFFEDEEGANLLCPIDDCLDTVMLCGDWRRVCERLGIKIEYIGDEAHA